MTVLERESLFNAHHEESAPRILTTHELRLASYIVDGAIAGVQKSLLPRSRSQRTFRHKTNTLQHAIDYATSIAEPDSEPIIDDYVMYYGLLGRTALAVTTTIAPAVVTEPLSNATRKNAVNGVSGQVAELLGQALQRYDHSLSYVEKRELSGAIGELHFFSMANFHETGDRIAVPAPLHEDLYRRTDAYIFHRQNNTAYRASVQVKSYDAQAAGEPPINGFTVTGRDMANLYNDRDSFPLSRALVALYETGRVTPQESNLLEAGLAATDAALAEKLALQPGVHLKRTP